MGGKKKRRQPRHFTEDDKKKIVARADEIGAIAASKEFDVGNSVIYSWRAKFNKADNPTAPATRRAIAKSGGGVEAGGVMELIAKQEAEIVFLKKCVAYFSNPDNHQ